MTTELLQAITAAQQGDKQAFYILYQQFIGRVYAICWRLLANKQKAEDTSQEVFIKAYQAFERFEADAALRVAGALELAINATSLGGPETLVEHRASIEGANAVSPDNLLRVSVGLEHPDDLLADFDRALGAVGA